VFRLFAAIAVLVGLFAWGYPSIQGQKDIASVLRIGLESADPRTIIQSESISEHGISGIIQNTLAANSSQVIISIVYFSYNATITSMLLAYEWSGFFQRAKSLRVSRNRHGLQRSTYFLQLPYRYALPLLSLSALLHWLASQSLSVVSVELYNMFGAHNSSACRHDTESFVPSDRYLNLSCGHDFVTMSYSPLGILLSLIVVVVLTVGLIVLGRKKLNPMPVVRSCSAAVAASCHGSLSEQSAWEKPLGWGVFSSDRNQQDPSIGQCGLSSNDVEQPVSGTLYT
jgi:hypothetical protein